MTRHYHALDGLRGTAALIIVIFHGGALFGQFQPMSAYLEVDVFFVLSGFVLAHSYRNKLLAGMTTVSFLQLRAARLLPLYCFGTLLGAGLVLAGLMTQQDAGQWTLSKLAISLPLAMSLLPSPVSVALFPLDVPSWSLFFEAVVNIVLARITKFAASRFLVVIAAAMLGVVIFQAIAFGDINQGWSWSTAIWAVPRTFFSFSVGLLLYRVHTRIPTTRIPSLALLLLQAALMFAAPTGAARTVFDLVFVIVLSPGIVLLSATAASSQGSLCRAYQRLGAMSYPLYVTHHPVLSAVNGFLRSRPALLADGPLKVALGFSLLAAMAVASWYLAGWDVRFRRRSTRAPFRMISAMR